MAQIVIVEGIDRVGKTTFIDRFVEKNPDFKRFKHKPSDFDYNDMDNKNETDKMLQLLEMVKLLDGKVIFDRFHFSNMVYGFLDRNYDPFEAMKFCDDIEQRIIKLFGPENVVVVMLFPEDIEKSSKEHGKDLTPYQHGMEAMSLDTILPVMVASYETIDAAIEVIPEFFLHGDKACEDCDKRDECEMRDE